MCFLPQCITANCLGAIKVNFFSKISGAKMSINKTWAPKCLISRVWDVFTGSLYFDQDNWHICGSGEKNDVRCNAYLIHLYNEWLFKTDFSPQKHGVVHYMRYVFEIMKFTFFSVEPCHKFDPKCLHIAYT